MLVRLVSVKLGVNLAVAVAGPSEMERFVLDRLFHGSPVSAVGADIDHPGMAVLEVADRSHAELPSGAAAGCRRGEAGDVGWTAQRVHCVSPGGVTETEDVIEVPSSEPVKFGFEQGLSAVVLIRLWNHARASIGGEPRPNASIPDRK